MNVIHQTLASCLVLAAANPLCNAECLEIQVIGWNMQSDFEDGRQESDPEFLGQQMEQKGSIDIWGLSEVLDQESLNFFEQSIEAATGKDYIAKLSTRGNRDRLAILYRADRFHRIGDFFELTRVQVGNRGLRPALAVQLEGVTTGQQFYFMVNHFKCCGRGQETRVKQAKALNSFARSTNLPIIAVGDLNTPFNVRRQRMPKALKQLTADGPFRWIKPGQRNIVPTEDSGRSILDYVLVANQLDGWEGRSTILRRDGNQPAGRGDDFSDDQNTTDHRPVKATFKLDCDERIDALEEEIAITEARLAFLRGELNRLQNESG